jgi:hypothetical protein
MLGFSELSIIIIGLGVIALLGLAVYKVIKSKLPDWEKIFWILAIIVLNIIAAIPFIIFHDFFLSKEKRGKY